MLGSLEAILAGFGLKLPVIFSSCVGGFFSLSFFEDHDAEGRVVPMARKKKWMVFGTGAAIGMYAAGPLLDWSLMYVTLNEKAQLRLEVGFGLFVALAGMSFMSALIKAWPDILQEIKKRIPGGGR